MTRQKSKSRKTVSKPSLNVRWQSWYTAKKAALRFVAKFAILMVLFYGVSATPYFDRILFSYLEANAWLSNIILKGFGQPTSVSKVTIQSPQFAIVIRRGCDAVEPTWLFCAAVFSCRAPLMRKLPGVLVGIFLLQSLNLVRIVSLYWIGLYYPGIFDSAHMEIWPTAFIIVAIVLFTCWIEWSCKEPSAHAVP